MVVKSILMLTTCKIYTVIAVVKISEYSSLNPLSTLVWLTYMAKSTSPSYEIDSTFYKDTRKTSNCSSQRWHLSYPV